MANEAACRPEVYDWGVIGETCALRRINVGDPVDIERYWETNTSVGPGLMVDDIETVEELVENARSNGRASGFTLAISGIVGSETGEFQGFVQFTPDSGDELRHKIEETGLFRFLPGVVIWEVSYAKYPPSAPRQVASAVRQASLWLIRKLRLKGFYPRIAILGATEPDINPGSVRVLQSACYDPIGTDPASPKGIIKYVAHEEILDSVWLLNWTRLHHRLREKATPDLETKYREA